MKAYGVTREQMEKALALVNTKYDGNITWNRVPEPKGKAFNFTLTVHSSKSAGHRLGMQHGNGKQRRIAAACWHVHGHFFEALLSIAPDARIITTKSVITKYGGNWQDCNIGSMMFPMYYSEACECC